MNTAVAEKPAESAESKPAPLIDWTAVESSQMAKIGHDPATNTLGIQFWKRVEGEKVPGSIYYYDDFTVEDFEKFTAAESKGAHLGTHIKGKFPFVKVS